MTQQMILDMLREGRADELYHEGLLDVCDLRYAVERGWMTLEDATSWYECLMDI